MFTDPCPRTQWKQSVSLDEHTVWSGLHHYLGSPLQECYGKINVIIFFKSLIIVETMSDYIFGGSKITADGDCSQELKRCLLLGRKVMTNLDSIFKSRDTTLPTKVHLVKVMVFPVVMYGCESWTVKKAECQRIDAFELWCWRRLLRVPWTARRSNQSILKEISPRCWLEGLMLKLKLQYFGHLMWRISSLEKTLVFHSVLQWTTFCQTSPPWPAHPGWPHTAWLSFIELDKAVVHVIRLARCPWL